MALVKKLLVIYFLCTSSLLADTYSDKLFWNEIKNSNDIELFQLYITNYPNGIFVPIAKNKIEKLRSNHPNELTETTKPAWLEENSCMYTYCAKAYANAHFKGVEYQKKLAIKRADGELEEIFDSMNFSQEKIDSLKTQIKTKIYIDQKQKLFVLRYIP
ncbi:MAG: hypothetical protein IE909_01450 [Campylobacterales bacterium]|nr:hypothetical protein [Campylobacterales bacterium]